MLNPLAITTAARLRAALVKDGSFGNRLECACAVASWKLTRHLRNRGLPAEFILGEYGPYKYDHCWVVLEGQIIDVTATQFDKKAPEVKVVPVTDKTYKALLRGTRAHQHIQDEWYSGQQPSNYRVRLAGDC